MLFTNSIQSVMVQNGIGQLFFSRYRNLGSQQFWVGVPTLEIRNVFGFESLRNHSSFDLDWVVHGQRQRYFALDSLPTLTEPFIRAQIRPSSNRRDIHGRRLFKHELAMVLVGNNQFLLRLLGIALINPREFFPLNSVLDQTLDLPRLVLQYVNHVHKLDRRVLIFGSHVVLFQEWECFELGECEKVF